jgi:hypothetical protein
LRARVSFANANEADSIVLVHEFLDGRRAVQVITQSGGGTPLSDLYVPARDNLSENGTTIIVVKRDPVTNNVKYTSTSIRLTAGQSSTVTLDIPEVSSEPNSAGGQTMCEIKPKVISGTVCVDFSQGAATDPVASAKDLCAAAQDNDAYSSATVTSSCPSSTPIKTCTSNVYKVTFYSSDPGQADNISCDGNGQWVWNA